MIQFALVTMMEINLVLHFFNMEMTAKMSLHGPVIALIKQYYQLSYFRLLSSYNPLYIYCKIAFRATLLAGSSKFCLKVIINPTI